MAVSRRDADQLQVKLRRTRVALISVTFNYNMVALCEQRERERERERKIEREYVCVCVSETENAELEDTCIQITRTPLLLSLDSGGSLLLSDNGDSVLSVLLLCTLHSILLCRCSAFT